MSDDITRLESVGSVFQACQAEAVLHKQRRLLLISGNKNWCYEQLANLLVNVNESTVLVAEEALEREQFALKDRDVFLPLAKAKQLLGTETALLVYDAFSGFNPDAIGTLAGTVVAGGVLVLLTPELDEWQNYLDPDYQRLLVHPFKPEQLEHLFIKRVAKSLQVAQGCWFFSQRDGVEAKPYTPQLQAELSEGASHTYCKTQDQRNAVDAIVKVQTGHRRRPLVITSDRGRGKSSSLGIAAAKLLSDSINHIVITAPRLESVKPVFDHASALLSGAELEQGKLHIAGKTLQYLPPDQLLRQLPKADLVLVDEAAAIPLPMLEQLVHQYSRLVFSSTIHGYEGSGRGFGLKFFELLDLHCSQWKRLELKQPIRWAANDPVEAWLFDALLLDAELSEVVVDDVTATSCEVKELRRRELIENENLLRQVFSLLVISHYQTTPSDLRNLLDGPNIRIWVALNQGLVVATALVTEEGGFNETLATNIWKGERRLRGHMLPQTLASHAGIEVAPKLKYQRIMRIAVQPKLQQKGLGQMLLKHISEQAEKLKVDILGSSFGVTEDVLHFWQRAGFSPVRLGVTRDACSGTHSALVLKSFNLAGEIVLDTVRFRFLDHLPQQLLTQFNTLEPELVAGLMLGNDYYDGVMLDEQDWSDITAFAEGYRVFEVCSVPLWKLVCCFMGQLEVRQWLSDQQRDLLIYLLLQNRPMPWVAKKLSYTGRKELIKALRDAIKLLSKQQTFLRSTSVH